MVDGGLALGYNYIIDPNQESADNKMNDQTCGNCYYFSGTDSDIYSGDCLWIIRNPVPIAYSDNVSSTYRTWGEDCPCWKEKKF